jgi:hypothetical protein
MGHESKGRILREKIAVEEKQDTSGRSRAFTNNRITDFCSGVPHSNLG